MGKEFVVGIPFSSDLSEVLLIHRHKNPFNNMYNGVGGHVEPGEYSGMAMYRELLEEADITAEQVSTMEKLVTLTFPNGVILHAFAIHTNLTPDANIRWAVSSDNSIEGAVIWQKYKDFLDVTSDRCAGDGNLPYFIWYGRKVLAGEVYGCQTQ